MNKKRAGALLGIVHRYLQVGKKYKFCRLVEHRGRTKNNMVHNLSHKKTSPEKTLLLPFRKKIKIKGKTQEDIIFRSYWRMGIFIA